MNRRQEHVSRSSLVVVTPLSMKGPAGTKVAPAFRGPTTRLHTVHPGPLLLSALLPP